MNEDDGERTDNGDRWRHNDMVARTTAYRDKRDGWWLSDKNQIKRRLRITIHGDRNNASRKTNDGTENDNPRVGRELGVLVDCIKTEKDLRRYK